VSATAADADAARVGAAVSEVVERIFATVAAVRTAALRSPARDGFATGRSVLGDDGGAALLEPGQLAVAPSAERGVPLRLEWWQVEPDGQLRAFDPDLRPTSVGYYDYTTAEWFDVPSRTGRRHVVGPHVDVHGTGRYLLTFTEPLVVDGEFVAVAGADVPVRRFESHLLHALGPLPASFLLLNAEGRVVFSTAPRWLVGSLVPPDLMTAGPVADVPGAPWRLLLVEAGGVLTA
jgi:hypothetical protein